MNRYNTFSGRFWAGIIDGLILLPFGVLDFFILDPEQPLGLVLPWMLFSYSSYFIYNIYFHWKTGQTIGKRLMKVKVMDFSEQGTLSFKQAVLRDGVYLVLQIIGIVLIFINIVRIGAYTVAGIEPYNSYLSYFSLAWFLIEIITLLTNEKGRALHDKIAGTVVINLKETDNVN